MTNIYSYGNSFIIENRLKEVDITLLGKVINRWLKNSGDTTINDSLTRCREYKDYIIIAPYGSLVGDTLKNFIRDYVKVTNYQFRFYINLPDDIKELLLEQLPTIMLHKGSQCGGPIEDSDDIDLGVTPLCDVLNLFPNIKTFSSCEGHKTKESTSVLYVLFKIEGDNKFETLNKLTHILDSSFEEGWKQFVDLSSSVATQFLFGQGHWPEQNEVYFEIRISYNLEIKDTLFYAIKQISDMIKEKLQ